VLGASGLALAACTRKPAAQATPDPKASADQQLVERLAVAYGALRDAEGAQSGDVMLRNAQAAVDALAGPQGRHGEPYAPLGAVLPEDNSQVVSEPGLALRVYDAAAEGSPLRAAIDGRVLSSVAGWRTPDKRYEAIDRAVAEWTPEHDSVSPLGGEVDQALAWALLVPKTERLVQGRAHAERGAAHAKTALDTVRRARAQA
jgi:hypothetical protein